MSRVTHDEKKSNIKSEKYNPQKRMVSGSSFTEEY